MSKESHSLADLTAMESPSALMMIGIPGSGKSTIAAQIGELLTYRYCHRMNVVVKSAAMQTTSP